MMLTQIGLSPIGKATVAGSASSLEVEAGGGRGIWGNYGKQTTQSPFVCAAQGASKRW